MTTKQTTAILSIERVSLLLLALLIYSFNSMSKTRNNIKKKGHSLNVNSPTAERNKTLQPPTTYTYESYKMDGSKLVSICTAGNFKKLHLKTKDVVMSSNIDVTLEPLIKVNGGTPIDTTGLITPQGTITNLGKLDYSKHDYYFFDHVKPKQLGFLIALKQLGIVDSYLLNPTNGRPHKPSELNGYLCYEIIGTDASGTPIDLLKLLLNVNFRKAHHLKDNFYVKGKMIHLKFITKAIEDLLELNPCPPGSKP